jgi:peptidoglycan/xylan/chitin deacetylase (PgdA/CDA1 family)
VPAVALTFDDGPGAVTAGILEVLAAHGARATFDVLGERIAGGEGVLRRAVSAGHELGVHGWRHGDHRDHPWARARGAGRTARLLAGVCGVRARVFRPPFGATNRRLEVAIAVHGLRTVLWDVDPRDFEEPGAAVIAERTLAGVRPGSIVLLHDDRPELTPTIEALDVILRELSRRGLATATVSQLLRGLGPSGPG